MPCKDRRHALVGGTIVCLLHGEEMKVYGSLGLPSLALPPSFTHNLFHPPLIAAPSPALHLMLESHAPVPFFAPGVSAEQLCVAPSNLMMPNSPLMHPQPAHSIMGREERGGEELMGEMEQWGGVVIPQALIGGSGSAASLGLGLSAAGSAATSSSVEGEEVFGGGDAGCFRGIAGDATYFRREVAMEETGRSRPRHRRPPRYSAPRQTPSVVEGEEGMGGAGSVGDGRGGRGISTDQPFSMSTDQPFSMSTDQPFSVQWDDSHGVQCIHTGCTKSPCFGVLGGPPVSCADHRGEGDVDVRHDRCRFAEGCSKQGLYSLPEAPKDRYCFQHKEAGMFNTVSKLCSEKGCRHRPVFGSPIDR